MYSNNLQFSAAVLLSGNNYWKVELMSRFLAYCVMLTDAMQDYIVHLECLDKCEVGGKSSCMEKEALTRAIQNLTNIVNLTEVVTDASSSIIKMMGNLFYCAFIGHLTQGKVYTQVPHSGVPL